MMMILNTTVIDNVCVCVCVCLRAFVATSECEADGVCKFLIVFVGIIRLWFWTLLTEIFVNEGCNKSRKLLKL